MNDRTYGTVTEPNRGLTINIKGDNVPCLSQMLVSNTQYYESVF